MSAAALTAGTTSATNTRATGETFYRPELDALRFFAFLAVMVHHYLPQTSTFYESRLHASAASANWMVAVAGVGGLGVELFFVLSAFLITSLLLRERAARGEVHIAAFYPAAGLAQDWPLYFFFLALVFLFAHLTHDVGFNFRLHDAGAFAIFIGNWLGNLDAVPLSVVPLMERVRRRAVLPLLALGHAPGNLAHPHRRVLRRRRCGHGKPRLCGDATGSCSAHMETCPSPTRMRSPPAASWRTT